ncbi:D-site 20S pre-rRNA nuclease [Patellaria atrata CBS 101060]|uniref:20S-pre-rRNA D-site endonuclease NOB1 n=1 Tax=Patellaria atrata CBS 101060 TaxID=1346257 RepID=A0A9P4SGC3_9PEZI|nr:D-site 20S pre-rRNA nuclease [Patellaria atrata CBS 101060]
MATEKPVHTIVLDAGPIIKGEPAVSSLLAKSDCLVTTPAVISEIKDPVTRSRLETILVPFLTLRRPKPQSIKHVSDFARRTGDLVVLSKADIEIIALAYDIECERNGGDWRLRDIPGQKRTNGALPAKLSAGAPATEQDAGDETKMQCSSPEQENVQRNVDEVEKELSKVHLSTESSAAASQEESSIESLGESHSNQEPSVEPLEESPLSQVENSIEAPKETSSSQEDTHPSESDSDSEGWITPSNLKKHLEKYSNPSFESSSSQDKHMQVATLTTDFAMQNVLLQMNLNLLSSSFSRVRHLKTFVLRCHACFSTTKEMNKQFCPRCGKPTLTRVACSTDQNGEFKLHLKKNMQWNNRGNVYSIPKPVSGHASGKVNVGGGGKGGGKGGWGQGLILAEDQKEYVNAVSEQKRTKTRNLMDEDYLPAILSGERSRAGGRLKVGAGRNVNSRKR